MMFLIRLALAGAFGYAALGFQPTDSEPPAPYALVHEHLKRNEPLAAYVELTSLEAHYQESGLSRSYFDSKASVLAMLGDTQGAMRSWAEINHAPRADGPLLNSALDDFRPVDAVDFIVEQADRYQIIMIGEEHVQPQTRSVLKPLLQRLHSKGFTYFAAETFSEDLEKTIERGYTLRSTGYYTREPVFAEAVNEALRLGYELVPYECRSYPEESPPDDPMFRQNHREGTQARNLKERIFDVDPEAKVIVWAGRSHVTEEAGEVPGVGTLKPMAYQFREMTGIDPFSVYLPAGAEQASPEFEFPVYRYACHHGWVDDAPTIFVNEDGETFGVGGDALVFFPRVQMKFGRPDWLERDLGRRWVDIPRELLVEKGHVLVQAFHVDDVENAVPVDQILIKPGDPVPVLMLPADAHECFIRSVAEDGTVRGPIALTLN